MTSKVCVPNKKKRFKYTFFNMVTGKNESEILAKDI